jgi:hypothetical protein
MCLLELDYKNYDKTTAIRELKEITKRPKIKVKNTLVFFTRNLQHISFKPFPSIISSFISLTAFTLY